jgi:hypothetical protein
MASQERSDALVRAVTAVAHVGVDLKRQVGTLVADSQSDR